MDERGRETSTEGSEVLEGGVRRGKYKEITKGKRKETRGGSIYAQWMARRHSWFLYKGGQRATRRGRNIRRL